MWATEYSRDEGLRKYWDEFTPPFHKDGDGPRTGQGRARLQPQPGLARDRERRALVRLLARAPRHGPRVNAGGVNIIFSDTNTHYRGAENYRRSGEVDAMRMPKDGFFAHQVMWDGWVDVEQPGIHIIGHWNYAPGTKKNVYVVSSGREGRAVRSTASRSASASRAAASCSRSRTWSGSRARSRPSATTPPARRSPKRRTKPPASRTPSGSRRAPDPAGCAPTARTSRWSTSKSSTPRAAAARRRSTRSTFDSPAPPSGAAASPKGRTTTFSSKRLPVECGVNRVIVRSTDEPGTITLTAHRRRARSPRRSNSRRTPSPSTDGWTLRYADDGLPSYLDRGPTPAGRFGDADAHARCASRAPPPAATPTAPRSAYDDNETTAWDNGGGLRHAPGFATSWSARRR